MSVNFWWQLLNRWRCRNTFSEIFRIRRSRCLEDEIARNFIYKIYIIRNNNDAIWEHVSSYGALLFRFFQSSCDCSISDSISWNRTKFCMQYTYFKRWRWYNCCGYSLIRGAVVTIFLRIFWKMQILCSTEWNRIKIYMQDIYY